MLTQGVRKAKALFWYKGKSACGGIPQKEIKL